MSRRARLAVSLILLGGALLVTQFRSAGEAIPLRKSLDAFPAVVGGWRAQASASLDTDTVNLLKVNDYVLQRYVDRGGQSLWLYIAFWATQRKGAQIHSPQNCLPGAGWEPVEAARIVVPLDASGRSILLNRYVIQREGVRQVVFYWYHSQGKDVAGEVQARVAMVQNALFHNRTDGALIRISSPIQGTAQDTTERLVRYVQALYPILGEYLPD